MTGGGGVGTVGAGDLGVAVVGDHLWYASVGCAGFPPARE